MDNLTHSLCGLALARAGGDRLGRFATPVLVVAANLPDIDIVGRAWGGQPWFLCHHRGLTHAVVGLGVQAVLLGVVAWALARRFAEGKRPGLAGLIAAAALGLASHLLLDGLNTYGVRPWLPWDERWVYGDIAFIVDPWLWLAFGAAAYLGAPRVSPPDVAHVVEAAERRASAAIADVEQLALEGRTDEATRRADVALAALGEAGRVEDHAAVRRAWSSERAWWTGAVVLLLAISALAVDRAPVGVPIVWGGLAALVLFARRRIIARVRRAAPDASGSISGDSLDTVASRRLAGPSILVSRHALALIPLALAAGYLVVLAQLSREADHRARAAVLERGDRAGAPIEASVCHAAPAVPWRFRSIVATPERLLVVDVDLRTGEATPGRPVPRNLDDPALPLVLDTPEHHAWRVFARLPFVQRDGARLVLGDGRYSLTKRDAPPRRTFSDLELILPENAPPPRTE